MKLTILLSALCTVGLALKQHLHKRETHTVLETQFDIQTVNEYVTVYEDDDVTLTDAPATSASVPVPVSINAQKAVSSVSSTSAASSTTSSAPTSSTSSAPKSSASSSAPASASSASSSSTSGSATDSGSTASPSAPSYSGGVSSGSGSAGSLGIAYSPYQDNGQCKTADQVKSDIKKLLGYNIIRLYAVDCSGVQNVLSAMTSNQKVFAGLYTLNNIESDVNSLNSQIKAAGKDWSVIDTVSVGNELVNSGQATTGQIEQAISTARSALSAKGYTGPVVSVDTFTAVINNPALCEYSDYIAVNCHAYFDGSVGASNAGLFVEKQIERVRSTCGGKKDVLITETGWPHSGNSNGAAIPSLENQESALSLIKLKVGGKVFLFTMYNDKWKQPGAYNVEQSWGIYGNSPN